MLLFEIGDITVNSGTDLSMIIVLIVIVAKLFKKQK